MNVITSFKDLEVILEKYYDWGEEWFGLDARPDFSIKEVLEIAKQEGIKIKIVEE